MLSLNSAIRSRRARLAALALSFCVAAAMLHSAPPASARSVLPLQALLTALIGFPPAKAPVPPPITPTPNDQSYGFNDSVWTIPQIPNATALKAMKAVGAKYWRSNLSWQYFEPRENQIDPYFLDNQVSHYNQMRANGQTPVFLVIGTPFWALTSQGRGASKGRFLCADNNNATQCNAPPDVRDPHIKEKWQHFLQVMAYAMPEAVFEIWNEPNIDYSWLQPQDPELYGLMLKSAGEAIHAISPTTKVLSGGVNAYSLADNPAMTGFESFLQQMYATAGKTSFDGLAFHDYPCAGASAAQWTPYVSEVIARVRAVRDASGDAGKPMWMTETGATTGADTSTHCGGHFTEVQQGDAVGAVMGVTRAENDAHHDLPVVLVNSLFNLHPRTSLFGTSNNTAEGEFGFIAWLRNPIFGTITFKNKPAYDTLVCKFAGSC